MKWNKIKLNQWTFLKRVRPTCWPNPFFSENGKAYTYSVMLDLKPQVSLSSKKICSLYVIWFPTSSLCQFYMTCLGQGMHVLLWWGEGFCLFVCLFVCFQGVQPRFPKCVTCKLIIVSDKKSGLVNRSFQIWGFRTKIWAIEAVCRGQNFIFFLKVESWEELIYAQ